jgi:hypothetical protein
MPPANSGSTWRRQKMKRRLSNGWPVKLADDLGDDENALAAVRFWGERYNLCGFSADGDVEWVASEASGLLAFVTQAQR